MARILYDSRWVGNHGIGRFASELRRLLPGIECFDARRRPWHPFDCALLGAELWRIMPTLFFSPGCNPPMGWPFRFVFTLHDLNHLCVSENTSSLKRAYYNHVIRPACRNAAFVLTVSEYSRNCITEWAGVPGSKVVNVSNGVGEPFVASGQRYDPGYPYLLYVGSRKPHKNIPRLLRAFAVSGVRSEIRLVLNGARDAEISAQMDAVGLKDEVQFVECVQTEQLAELYRGAVGFVFPSLYEGFGLPPLEAMACGVPVLTSDVCAIPEVVGDAAILVNPLEVEAIAEGMRRVVSSDSLRGDMRVKGLRRAQAFAWGETARKTWIALENAAA